MKYSPYDKWGRHKSSSWFLEDIKNGYLVSCGWCEQDTKWTDNKNCDCCGNALIYPKGASW